MTIPAYPHRAKQAPTKALCSVPGCNQAAQGLMCRDHWFMLSTESRRKLVELGEEHRARRASKPSKALVELLTVVLAEISYRSAGQRHG